MKLEYSLTSYRKVNSKWFKDINIGHDTIKLLEENTGKTFSDINHSSIFLDQSPKAEERKAKINKWDLIKHKTSAHQRKPSTKQKDNLRTERKYVLMMQSTRG